MPCPQKASIGDWGGLMGWGRQLDCNSSTADIPARAHRPQRETVGTRLRYGRCTLPLQWPALPISGAKCQCSYAAKGPCKGGTSETSKAPVKQSRVAKVQT